MEHLKAELDELKKKQRESTIITPDEKDKAVSEVKTYEQIVAGKEKEVSDIDSQIAALNAKKKEAKDLTNIYKKNIKNLNTTIKEATRQEKLKTQIKQVEEKQAAAVLDLTAAMKRLREQAASKSNGNGVSDKKVQNTPSSSSSSSSSSSNSKKKKTVTKDTKGSAWTNIGGSVDRKKLETEFNKNKETRPTLKLGTLNTLLPPFKVKSLVEYGSAARIPMVLCELLDYVPNLRADLANITKDKLRIAINGLLGTNGLFSSATKDEMLCKWERAILIRMRDMFERDPLDEVPVLVIHNGGPMCPQVIEDNTFNRMPEPFKTGFFDQCGPSATLGLRMRNLLEITQNMKDSSQKDLALKNQDLKDAIEVLVGREGVPSDSVSRDSLLDRLLQIVRNMREAIKVQTSTSKGSRKGSSKSDKK